MYAPGRVFAACCTSVQVTGSWPAPRARDPGLHRPPSHALSLSSSWQPVCRPPTRRRPVQRVWPRPAVVSSTVARVIAPPRTKSLDVMRLATKAGRATDRAVRKPRPPEATPVESLQWCPSKQASSSWSRRSPLMSMWYISLGTFTHCLVSPTEWRHAVRQRPARFAKLWR